jgi:hypothetical protein
VTKTFIHPDSGLERPDRRINLRTPKADHLFDGFRNRIDNAKEDGDLYVVGYLGAMVKELGTLTAEMALLRSALEGFVEASTPEELAILRGQIEQLPIPDSEKVSMVNAVDALITTA